MGNVKRCSMESSFKLVLVKFIDQTIKKKTRRYVSQLLISLVVCFFVIFMSILGNFRTFTNIISSEKGSNNDVSFKKYSGRCPVFAYHYF